MLSVRLHEMSAPELRHTYHDASIVAFAAGPRNEIRLEIALDPVWNTCRSVVLRFGAIANLAEVTSFFGRIPPKVVPEAHLATIERLEYKSSKPATAVLQLDGLGTIEIESAKVTESDAV